MRIENKPSMTNFFYLTYCQKIEKMLLLKIINKKEVKTCIV